MKAFVPRILNSTCPLGTPSELEGAYGNPSSFLLLACFWVVLRSSTPLLASCFRQVKGLVSAVFVKLLGFMRKRSETVENGVALTPTAETQTNPLAQMEEGLGERTGSGLSASSVGEVALTEGRKKLDESIAAAEVEVLESVDEATGGGSRQAKYKQPDKVRTCVTVCFVDVTVLLSSLPQHLILDVSFVYLLRFSARFTNLLALLLG